MLAEQQDPHSANYRRWLTPEQYAARFGMSDGDLAQVTSWLKWQGLAVDGFSRARARVFFSRTAAQVEGVFHAELHRYLVNGQMSLANATEISVPQAISGVVLGVRGLETFRPCPGRAWPGRTSLRTCREVILCLPETSPRSTTLIPCTPPDWMERERPLRSWDKLRFTPLTLMPSGLPPVSRAKNLDQSVRWHRVSAGDEVEADLDVEWSGAVARNATFSTFTPAATPARTSLTLWNTPSTITWRR